MARLASTIEVDFLNTIVLLKVEGKAFMIDVGAITEKPNWRIPIVKLFITRQMPEHPGSPN